MVTVRMPSGKQYLDFVYFPTDADWFNMSEVQLRATEPPDAMSPGRAEEDFFEALGLPC